MLVKIFRFRLINKIMASPLGNNKKFCSSCKKTLLKNKLGIRKSKQCGICKKNLSNVNQEYCKECAPLVPPSSWGIETALLSGIIASDGWLFGKRRNIGFANTDSGFMKAFLLLVNTKRKPTQRHNKRGKDYEEFCLTDHALYNLMIELGITPCKSLTIGTLKLPKDVDGRIDYFWLFLRGAFYGDGHISKTTQRFKMNICSGSEKYLFWLRKEIALHLDNKDILQAMGISYSNKAKAYYLNMPKRYFSVLYENMFLQYQGNHIREYALNNIGHTSKNKLLYRWYCMIQSSHNEKQRAKEKSSFITRTSYEIS